MQPDYVFRANIKHYEQLLASGSLDLAQTVIVRGLLDSEVEALAQLLDGKAVPPPGETGGPAHGGPRGLIAVKAGPGRS